MKRFRSYATDGSAAGNTTTINTNVTAAATPTPVSALVPAATPTIFPTSETLPARPGGLVSLEAGMLVTMVIALRFTSDSRPTTGP
jgi:hypothetical protein